MKSEQKYKLFGVLKKEFESATDFSNYTHWNIEFEIDEDCDEEDTLECDVTITAPEEETIIRLSINRDRHAMVNTYEDVWEEWTSYNYDVANLWRQIFFNKRNVE